MVKYFLKEHFSLVAKVFLQQTKLLKVIKMKKKIFNFIFFIEA